MAALVGMPPARAAIDPSEPAPLTKGPFFEFGPHLTADGTELIFSGLDVLPSPSRLGFEQFALTLHPPCRESTVTRLTDSDEPHGVSGTLDTVPPHASISDDGSILAYAVFDQRVSVGPIMLDEFEVWALDRISQVRVALRDIWIDEDDPPKLHVSGDGSHVLVNHAIESNGSSQATVRRLAIGPCMSGCDCEVTSSGVNKPIASTHSAISQDGTVMAVGTAGGGDSAVLLVTMAAGSCASTTQAIAPHAGGDITISADATKAAWVTSHDYETGGTLPNGSRVWIWDSTRDPTDPCPGDQCVASPAGGTLVRIKTDGLDDLEPIHEKPFVSGNGKRVFFVANADFSDLIGSVRPRLWVVDLDLSSWSPQVVTSLRTGDFEGAVRAATASHDGHTVAFEEERDLDGDGTFDVERDLFLVQVDDTPVANAVADSDPRPANVPFEVNDVSCTHQGGGDVDLAWEVRQFRGGERRLVMVGEVQGSGGAIHRTEAIVQRMLDETHAEPSVTVTLTDGDANDITTCRVQVIDGDHAQADAVTATAGGDAP